MNTIGIYPGRFQPAHKGHLAVYDHLKRFVGGDTFIATSDKQPTPDSPLNFGEKQQILVRHGIPSNHIVKVKNTYSPVEITNRFPQQSTAAIFALGGKDIERFGSRRTRDPKTGKEMWMKADGKTPGYFQPYNANNKDSLESLDKHGYVIIVPDVRINGKKISGTKIREAISSTKYTPEQKKKFFQWAFGWYDPSLYEMMVHVFSKAANTSPEENPQTAKQQVREIVSEILQEFESAYGGVTQGIRADADPGEEERKKDVAKSKMDASKMKAAAERELKASNTDLKWKQKSVEKLRQDDIPNQRDKIDRINKVISGMESPDALDSLK